MKWPDLNLILAKVRGNRATTKVLNWGRLSSFWPVHLATGCCSPEEMAWAGPRFDVERFGVLLALPSLRQCDLLVILGLVTEKMAKRVRLIYEQMAEPKYVMAIGQCAISGGMWFDSYNVVKGVDKVVPVDVYVPGCPPRPEAIIHGIRLLQEKVRKGS